MLFLTYRVYWSFWSLSIIFLKYILDDIFTGFIVFFCFESGLLWVTPRLIACSRTVTPVSRTNIWKNTTSLTELLLTSSKHREPLYWLSMLRGTWRLPHFYKGKKNGLSASCSVTLIWADTFNLPTTGCFRNANSTHGLHCKERNFCLTILLITQHWTINCLVRKCWITVKCFRQLADKAAQFYYHCRCLFPTLFLPGQ